MAISTKSGIDISIPKMPTSTSSQSSSQTQTQQGQPVQTTTVTSFVAPKYTKPQLNMSTGSTRTTFGSSMSNIGTPGKRQTFTFNGNNYNSEEEVQAAKQKYNTLSYYDYLSVGGDLNKYSVLKNNKQGLADISDNEWNYISRLQNSDTSPSAYTKSAADKYLQSMGLPSAKDLTQYRAKYAQYASSGSIADRYGNLTMDEYTYIRDKFNEDTIIGLSGERRDKDGKELKYEDTYLDDELRQYGLPSAKQMEIYHAAYVGEQKAKQTVATKKEELFNEIYNMRLNTGSEQAFNELVATDKYKDIKDYVAPAAIRSPNREDAKYQNADGTINEELWAQDYASAQDTDAKIKAQKELNPESFSYTDYERWAIAKQRNEKRDAENRARAEQAQKTNAIITTPAKSKAEKDGQVKAIDDYLRSNPMVKADGTLATSKDFAQYLNLVNSGIPVSVLDEWEQTGDNSVIRKWNNSSNASNTGKWLDVELALSDISSEDGDYKEKRDILLNTRLATQTPGYSKTSQFDSSVLGDHMTSNGKAYDQDGALYAAVNGKGAVRVANASPDTMGLIRELTTKDASGMTLADYLTEDERGAFNMMFRTSPEKAKEYFDSIRGIVENRQGGFSYLGIPMSSTKEEIANHAYDYAIQNQVSALQNIKEGNTEYYKKQAWDEYGGLSESALERKIEEESRLIYTPEGTWDDYGAYIRPSQAEYDEVNARIQRVEAMQSVLDIKRNAQDFAEVRQLFIDYTPEEGEGCTKQIENNPSLLYQFGIIAKEVNGVPYEAGARSGMTNAEAIGYLLNGGNADMAENPLAAEMTPEQKNQYNWLLLKHGQEEANKYYASIRSRLDAKASLRSQLKTQAEFTGDLAKDVGSSALSVLAFPVTGMMSFTGSALNAITGTEFTQTQATNWDFTGVVREGVRNDIVNAWDGNTVGSILGFLYDTGMSAADSSFGYAISSASGVPFLGEIAMSGSAYASALREGLSRGLDSQHAVGNAVAAAAIELITEHIGFDGITSAAENLVSSTVARSGKEKFLQLLATAGLQSIPEGLEELSGSIAGAYFDYLINADKSEWTQTYNDYIQQGYDEKAAKFLVARDFAGQAALEGLAGGLAGGAQTMIYGGVALRRANRAEYGGALERWSQGDDARAKNGYGAVFARGRSRVESVYGKQVADGVQDYLDNAETIGDKHATDELVRILPTLPNTSWAYSALQGASNDEIKAMAAALSAAGADASVVASIEEANAKLMLQGQSADQVLHNTNPDWIKTAEEVRTLDDNIRTNEEATARETSDLERQISESDVALAGINARILAATKKSRIAEGNHKSAEQTALSALNQEKERIVAKNTKLKTTDTYLLQSENRRRQRENERMTDLKNKHYASLLSLINSAKTGKGFYQAQAELARREVAKVQNDIDTLLDPNYSLDDESRAEALGIANEQLANAQKQLAAWEQREQHTPPSRVAEAVTFAKQGRVKEFIASMESEAAQRRQQKASSESTASENTGATQGETTSEGNSTTEGEQTAETTENTEAETKEQPKKERAKKVVHNISKTTQGIIEKMVHRFNMKMEVVWDTRENIGGNGKYSRKEPNKIYLAVDPIASENLTDEVVVAREFFTHELTHYVANTQAYQALSICAQMYFRNQAKERGADGNRYWDYLIERMKEVEREHTGRELSDPKAREELTAHFVQDVLFSGESGNDSQRAVKWLAGANSNIAKNLLLNVQYLIKRGQVRRLKGGAAKALLLDAEHNLALAIKERAELDAAGLVSAFASDEVSDVRSSLPVEEQKKTRKKAQPKKETQQETQTQQETKQEQRDLWNKEGVADPVASVSEALSSVNPELAKLYTDGNDAVQTAVQNIAKAVSRSQVSPMAAATFLSETFNTDGTNGLEDIFENQTPGDASTAYLSPESFLEVKTIDADHNGESFSTGATIDDLIAELDLSLEDLGLSLDSNTDEDLSRYEETLYDINDAIANKPVGNIDVALIDIEDGTEGRSYYDADEAIQDFFPRKRYYTDSEASRINDAIRQYANSDDLVARVASIVTGRNWTQDEVDNVLKNYELRKLNESKTKQYPLFDVWFADSKTTKRGVPMVLYHRTNANFTTFDTSRSGSNQGKTHGDGIYLSESRDAFNYAGNNVMELYASIQNPFEMNMTEKEATYVFDKYFAPFAQNASDSDSPYRYHVIESLKSRTRVFDYLNEAAEKNGVKTSEILAELNYDGVHDGIEWVAFVPAQVKSADEVTFDDNGNPIPNELRYQITDDDTRFSEGTTLEDLSEGFDNQYVSGMGATMSGEDVAVTSAKQAIEDSAVLVNGDGEPVMNVINDGESAMFSLGTFDGTGREALDEFLRKQMKKNNKGKGGITRAQAEDITRTMNRIYGFAKEYADKDVAFGAWSYAKVRENVNGSPALEVVTPNAEYNMNIDFSLVCVKRRALNAVMNEIVRRGLMEKLLFDGEAIARANERIKELGYETACKMCFVETMRYQQASFADKFVDRYNKLVKSLGGDADYFNFGGNDTIKATEGITRKSDGELDFTEIDKVLDGYAQRKKGLKSWKGMPKYSPNKVLAGANTDEAIAYELKYNPASRRLLLRGDFMSTNGFDALAMRSPSVLKLWNKKGQGAPKNQFSDMQYMNDIAHRISGWTPAKAYNVGGVRVQSFSDYVPTMFFDYVQMVAELAGGKLPAHAYTKELNFVKLFGMTGIKINMSLVPMVGDAGAGLKYVRDENGNIVKDENGEDLVTYAWAEESFGYDRKKKELDYDLIRRIQNDKDYGKNCGSIAIGVSNEHIHKMLDDPDIRMVIPYHKSNLATILAEMMHIDQFTNYESTQHTRKWNGDKWVNLSAKEEFPFNEKLHAKGDVNAVVAEYLEWCKKFNYAPKFEENATSTEFKNDPHYYKLLEDFTLFDSNGNYVPQQAVQMKYAENTTIFSKDGSPQSVEDLFAQSLKDPRQESIKGNVSKMADEVIKVLSDDMYSTGTSLSDLSGDYLETLDDIRNIYNGQTQAAQEDAEYMRLAEAYKNGDKSVEAQLRSEVYSAANSAMQDSVVRNPDGSLQVVYHGSIKTFNTFDKSAIRPVDYDAPFNGFWFTSSEEGASPAMRTANYVRPFYLDIKNPAPREVWRRVSKEVEREFFSGGNGVRNEARSTNDEIRFRLSELGYDGIHYDGAYNFDESNVREYNETGSTTFTNAGGVQYDLKKSEYGDARLYPHNSWNEIMPVGTAEDFLEENNNEYRTADVWVAFESEQMKSADLVTYDNEGNIIPLSERFNSESDDVRYSTGLSTEDLLDEYIKKYGMKEQDEFARENNIRTPERTKKTNRVSDAIQTLKEVPAIKQSIRNAIDEGVLEEGLGVYNPVTLDTMRDWGREYIAKAGGVTQAMRDLTRDLPRANYKDVVNLLSAANQVFLEVGSSGVLNDEKTLAEFMEFQHAYVDARSQWGRAGRVMQLVRDTPAGRVSYWEHVVDKLNESYRNTLSKGVEQLFNRKWKEIEVPANLYRELAEATTSEEINKAEYAITEYIGQNSPLTVAEALRNWRYFSMLGNPVTHARNMLGNTTMQGGVIAKDAVAAGMEALAVKMGLMDANERTHAIVLSQDKATKDYIDKLYDKHKDAIKSGGRDGFTQQINEIKKRAPWKGLDFLMRANTDYKTKNPKLQWLADLFSLEGEDGLFLNMSFKKAAAQYIKAQGIDVNDMTKAQEKAIVAYATQQAQEATYRDASKLADALNQFARSGWAQQLIVEAAMPFKKTPINITKRGLSYSPAGLAKGLFDLAQDAVAKSKGKELKVPAAKVVDELAEGLVGSALMLVGFFLAKAGILKMHAGSGGKDDPFARDLGHQDYSLEIGDLSIKIESLAPMTFPLFMGAALDDAFDREGDGLTFSELAETMLSIADPLMDMSFMSSLNSALETYNENQLAGVAMNLLQSYGSQYIPTIGGKINNVVNPTRRTTKSDVTSPLGGETDYWLRSLAAKVPGANQLWLQPYVKTTGEYDKKTGFGDYAMSFLNNLVLPTNVQRINRDYAAEEITRLAAETGNMDFVPRNPSKSFTKNKQPYQFNATEYTEFSKDHNETVFAVMTGVIDSDEYRNASDDERVEMLTKAYNSAHKTASDKWKAIIMERRSE